MVRITLLLSSVAFFLTACADQAAQLESQADTVSANAETAPMQGSGDVADDMALWVHPSAPSKSVLIGTNKSKDDAGGLYAFDLTGQRFGVEGWKEGVNRFEDERYNSVDLRYSFPAGSERWDLVATSNRSDREIDIFRVKQTRERNFAGLEKVGELALGDGLAAGSDAPYGLSMYASTQGKYYVFISDKAGRVAQYELSYNAAGSRSAENKVTARRLGLWRVSQYGSPVEGIVADDKKDVVYIASEDEGIYRYATRNGVLDPSSKVVVDTPQSSRLEADIEGLTLYYAANGAGYLIASSQGSSSFAVYERAFSSGRANAYVSSFQIGSSSVGSVSKTDGIDVSSLNLGGNLSGGAFFAHDGQGETPSNYKIVPWTEVAGSALRVDTSQNPRSR